MGARSIGQSRKYRLCVVAAVVTAVLAGSTTVASAAANRSNLLVSASSDRSSPTRLGGASLKGDVFIFLKKAHASSVSFYVDRSNERSLPYSVDSSSPFDLVAPASNGSAQPLNTAGLSNGSHTIYAIAKTDGRRVHVYAARFKVDNSTAGQTTTTTTKPTTTIKPVSTTQVPVSTSTTTKPVVTTSTSTRPSVTTTTVKQTTTTTVSPSTTGKNCAPNPSSCGFPDATNTGVPASAQLTKVPSQATSGPGWQWNASYGTVDVRTDGAVISNLDVSGIFEVYANNVTIKNSRITAQGESWGVGLRRANNATIANNTISSPAIDGPNRLLVGIKDIYGDTTGAQILGNNISHTSTAIQIANGLVADNYVHDYGYNAGDHLNGVSVGGGDLTAMTIRHNTILDQHDQTDAIALFQDFGNEANKTITDNLIAGGSYSLYGGDGDKGTTNHIVITNNHFSRIYFANGGTFGPAAHFEANGPGNVWSGNVWDDTGLVLNA